MARGDKPVQTFKHRGIAASVFENTTEKEGEKLTFFRVCLRRTYKQDGQFVSNSNFSRDDIPLACHLLEKAWEWIVDAEMRVPEQSTAFDDNPFEDPPKRKTKVRS